MKRLCQVKRPCERVSVRANVCVCVCGCIGWVHVTIVVCAMLIKFQHGTMIQRIVGWGHTAHSFFVRTYIVNFDATHKRIGAFIADSSARFSAASYISTNVCVCMRVQSRSETHDGHLYRTRWDMCAMYWLSLGIDHERICVWAHIFTIKLCFHLSAQTPAARTHAQTHENKKRKTIDAKTSSERKHQLQHNYPGHLF